MIILAHDFETTGLDTAKCGVVQYAIAILDVSQGVDGDIDVNVLEQYKGNCHPGEPIPEVCTKVHGLTDADVINETDWKIVLKEAYRSLFERFDIQYIMGYNNRNYDDPIAYRAGMPKRPSFDLFDYGRALKADKVVPGAKLTQVYEELVGEPLSGAHDAMVDITACIYLLPELAKHFGHTFEEMLDFATPKIAPEAIVGFGKHKGLRICDLPRGYANWVIENAYKMDRDVVATLKHLRGM